MEKSYVKSLDGIRGLAVLLVIFYHWPFPFLHLDFGWVGVQLFFVLSGYLITQSLMELKQYPAKTYFKNFYVKRILRIFPLYFGLLILLLLVFFTGQQLNPESSLKKLICNTLLSEWPETKKYLFTFTYNIRDLWSYYLYGNTKQEDYTAHLWSISVEEQFYFIYPFILFYLAPSQFKKFVVAGLVLFPVLRWGYVKFYFNPETDHAFAFGKTIYRNTFFQFDAFLTGAVLHFINTDKRVRSKFLLPLLTIIFILFLVFYAGDKPELLNTKNSVIGFLTLVNLSGLILIIGAIRNEFLRKLFEFPFLNCIGKISYGLYLFHYLLLGLFLIVKELWDKHYKTRESIPGELLLFAIYFLFLYAMGYLSYRFYENKFLTLKKKFN